MYVQNSFFFRLVPSNNLEIYFAQVAPDAIHSMCLLAHRAQSFNSQKYERRKKKAILNDNNKIASRDVGDKEGIGKN